MSIFSDIFEGHSDRYVSQPIYWTVTIELQPEDELRRIVREELADLVPVDVPDAPPKDL